MIQKRLFLCGGASTSKYAAALDEYKTIPLNSLGKKQNVNIQIENITTRISTNISDRHLDLLEIASYIYSADTSTQRGSQWMDDVYEPWKRDFSFNIAVQDLDFWNRTDVKRLLKNILSFLSDDKYEIAFEKINDKRRRSQQYFNFSADEAWPYAGIDRVIMFSGGLDSLGGVVDYAKDGKRALLVSHRPVAILSKRQRDLFNAVYDEYGRQFMHIPVWINKDKSYGREHTQRTRSFLYAVLGAVIGMSINITKLSFYENGIISLNLPIADEVLRSRASRTTHPITINLLSEFLSLVYERKFTIDNPFLFKTKKEIVEIIVKSEKGRLIGLTCSCAHTGIFSSKTQWHCGGCSQCIDRRVAVIAANAIEHEDINDYISEVFTGPRKEKYAQNYAINYVRHIVEMNKLSDVAFATKFGLELSRAARYERNKQNIIIKYADLHSRYAEYAIDVINRIIAQSSHEIITGSIQKNSLIDLIAKQSHIVNVWQRYANSIHNILRIGIPAICRTSKPTDENNLQEICDGILKSNTKKLFREFPFLKWSVVMTKPDFSNKKHNLWIELKYIREKKEVRRIIRDISEDITKYGDNEVNVLFEVYDPFSNVTDEYELKSDVLKHKGMMLRII